MVRLNPEDPPAEWERVKPENLRPAAAEVASATATCRYCLETGGQERLVRPCLCRGTADGVHLRCLQEAYVAMGAGSYPACPSCKGLYDGRTAVLCLERWREGLTLHLHKSSTPT